MPYTYRMVTVGSHPAANLSVSFSSLRELSHSFGRVVALTAKDKNYLADRAQKLGPTAIPLCLRELNGGDAQRADWSTTLLLAIAHGQPGRTRVVCSLATIVTNHDASDSAKARALCLLSELGAAIPSADLGTLKRIHEGSLSALAANLNTAADIARAGELLITELTGEELLTSMDALLLAAPERGVLLARELLGRHDLEDSVRAELRRLSAPAEMRVSDVKPAHNRSRARCRFYVGHRGDGQEVLIAVKRRPGSSPVRYRALCCLLSCNGFVREALYCDAFTRNAVQRELVAPLSQDGYDFASAADDAPGRLKQAVARTIELDRDLPRPYYVGRDLFGLTDEHTRGINPDARQTLDALLDRADDLLMANQTSRARTVLEHYVTAAPTDPLGHARLGLCLLVEHKDHSARIHLSHAAALDPTDALLHWNLASIHHRQRNLGACYLSLRCYMAHDDLAEDFESRRAVAYEFIAEYERFARLEYPQATPTCVARADNLNSHAAEAISNGHSNRAIAILRRAVKQAPFHYSSWTTLGTLLLNRSRFTDARRCFKRALAARPEFPPAIHGLKRAQQRLVASTNDHQRP